MIARSSVLPDLPELMIKNGTQLKSERLL